MGELGEQIRRYVEGAARPLRLDEVVTSAAERTGAKRRRLPVLLAAATGALAVGLGAFIAVTLVRSGSDDDRASVRARIQPTDVNEWQPIAPVPPELRDPFVGLGDFPQAVSTGADVYVFGGHSQRQFGLAAARYSPVADTWSVLPRAPIGQRANVIALWTGKELVVWGGSELGSGNYQDGAAYDAATNTWRRIADAPFEGGDTEAAAWTGTEMIIWGGAIGDERPGRGQAYNPSTDSWRRIADAPILDRPFPTAVWTGQEMIVWGGCAVRPPGNPGPCDHYAGNEPTDGAAYDPETDSWRDLPPSPLPPRPRPRSVWTGAEMIIWGSDVGPAGDDRVGAAYDPSDDTWRLLPPAPVPSSTRDFEMLWNGDEIFIVGGQADGFGGTPNVAYDPQHRRWTTLRSPPFSVSPLNAYAWTDAGLFAYTGARSSEAGAILER